MVCKDKTSVTRAAFRHPLGNLVNEIFNTALGDAKLKDDRNRATEPSTNVLAYKDRYVLEIALPGFTKNDVEIIVDKDQLYVSHKKEVDENSSPNYRLREFNFCGFVKTFKLPDFVDNSNISAQFSFGVLIVSLPLKEEHLPQPVKNISIN